VRAVNLLPSEARRRSRGAPNPAALASAIAGVVVVAVIGGGNLVQASRVAAAQRTLNDAKIQLAATPLPPPTPRVAPPPAAVAAEMAPRLQAVTTALASRIAWDRILREFSLVLPSDIQLTQLTLSQPGSAGQTSTGLQLSGVTYTYDSVARLLSRMALIPDLTGVTLGNTTVTSGIVSFAVTATVKGAPPAAVAPTLPTTTTTTTGASS
jgi:Fimbrial assembly protein (PilN)